MNSYVVSLSLGLCGTLLAQSPLNTIPTPQPTQWYLWTGCPNPNLFFNLTVNTTVTIQGLDVSLDNRAGAEGTIEVFVTNTATTHVGNELNAAAWTMRGSGPVTAVGQITPTTVGLTPGIVLQPGSYGIAVHYVGVRAAFALGNGTNQNFSNTEMSFVGGATQALAFGSAVFSPYIWYGRIHYALGNVPHQTASNTPYGAGCYDVNGSFYQRFTCAGPASTGLQGRALTLFFAGNGYVVAPGTGISYIPPTAAAVALPTNDDGETMVALTNSFVHPGGFTQQLWVHTNGYVSVASNPTMTPNNFTPFVPGLLDAAQMAWYSWHDYNTAEPGSGTIKFEEVGAMVFVTWQDVESWPGVTATGQVVNRSTLQFQFDTSTGNVHYVWQTITPIGTALDSDEHVIGFSPAGPSPDLGPIDIATLTAVTLTTPEVRALRVSASPSPTLGATVDYTTSNEPSPNLGLFFLSPVSLPGIDLGVIGMPGCLANIDIGAGVGNLITNLGAPFPSMTYSLTIPSVTTLLGLQLFGQSIWLEPTANPFGALTSNGVRSTIGNF